MSHILGLQMLKLMQLEMLDANDNTNYTIVNALIKDIMSYYTNCSALI